MAGGPETRLDPIKPSTPNTTMSATKIKKKGKTKSKLLSKFKNREVDPFAAQNKLVLQDMEEGMRDLLDLHNPAELSSLCAMLGMPSEGMTSEEKKDQILDHIKGPSNKPTEQDYITMMKMMWEGVMFEYLRSIGQPLRTCEQDPRGFIIRYWRRRITDPRNQKFVPYYLPRKFEQRSGRPRHDRDIAVHLNDIEQKELAVKQAEQCLRRENDYRFVLRYFTAVSELHNASKKGMDFMTNEAEILRARMEHVEENFNVTTEQLEELEYRHEVLKDLYVQKGAFDAAQTETFMGVLGVNMADRQEALTLVKHIFQDLGKTYKEDVEDESKDPDYMAEIGILQPESNPVSSEVDLVGRLEDLRRIVSEEIGRLDGTTRTAVQKMRDAQEELRVTQTKLAKQKERAELAEANLHAMGRKFKKLMEYSSQKNAESDATSDVLLGLVSQQSTQNARAQSRLQSVAPLLLKLASQGDPEKENLAITLIEALGIMSREGVLSHLEQLQMMKEDMIAKTAAATEGLTLKPPKKGGKKKPATAARKKR